MKIENRYQELLKLKEEIDGKLKNLDFDKIKELVLWLKKSGIFDRLKSEDNQLNMLEVFCNIWIEEKQQLECVGIHDDIFVGIQSLNDVESKYLAIKYCVLRMENEVPQHLCEQAVSRLIEQRVSGIAIGTVCVAESSKRCENIVRVAQLLKDKEETVRAMYLLQYANKLYPANETVLLELADCWLAGQQWQQAYECLAKIEIPDENIKELIRELEKVV